jgi:hypothetical protein
MNVRPLAPLFLLVSALLVACGDDGADKPTCVELGELCHDVTGDEAQACHVEAEEAATTEERCQEMEADCRALCE